MVYNTWNYWVSGLCPLSGFLKKLEDTTFRKPDLFPSSGEGETPLMGPLHTVNANQLSSD
jgi:hypothetical protein